MKSYKLSEFHLQSILILMKDRRDRYGYLDLKFEELAKRLGIYSDMLKPIRYGVPKDAT